MAMRDEVHDQQEMIRISAPKNARIIYEQKPNSSSSSSSPTGSSSNSVSSSEIEEEEEFYDVTNDENEILSSYVSNNPSKSLKLDVIEDCVYVAVGRTESSMDALSWTLSNYVNPNITIYLIHIFPEIRHIPSPMGVMPRHKVSPSIAEKYMKQERERRKALLQNFVDLCSSFKIQNKVDAVLIESDAIAKTIVSLIPILDINKLVLGTTKTSSKKAKFKKNGVAHQVFMNAPETCEVKLVCEGKQVMNPAFATPMQLTPSSSRKTVSEYQLELPEMEMVDRRYVACQCVCLHPMQLFTRPRPNMLR